MDRILGSIDVANPSDSGSDAHSLIVQKERTKYHSDHEDLEHDTHRTSTIS